MVSQGNEGAEGLLRHVVVVLTLLGGEGGDGPQEWVELQIVITNL